MPPGLHPADPDKEAARLIAQRNDPPGRVWGVRHPLTAPGLVTVRFDGHPFPSRAAADAERLRLDQDCEFCESHAHSLVWRDTAAWVSG